jgi:hypothetical protein
MSGLDKHQSFRDPDNIALEFFAPVGLTSRSPHDDEEV